MIPRFIDDVTSAINNLLAWLLTPSPRRRPGQSPPRAVLPQRRMRPRRPVADTR